MIRLYNNTFSEYYPWEDLGVGDWFEVPIDDERYVHIVSVAYRMGSKTGRFYEVKQIGSFNRVTRIHKFAATKKGKYKGRKPYYPWTDMDVGQSIEVNTSVPAMKNFRRAAYNAAKRHNMAFEFRRPADIDYPIPESQKHRWLIVRMR